MSSTDVVRSMYEAFASGDMPTVLGLLDPEVLWCEAEGSPYDSGDGWIGAGCRHGKPVREDGR